MKIVIVGPGAMGCLFGHFLARAGHELILLDHRPERARLLQEQGLLVETAAGTLRTPVQVAARPQDAGIAELCIVAVKAYATRAAAESSLPVVGPDTQVLSLQNGLGNVEALAEVIAPGRVLGGTTAQGANVVAPGPIITPRFVASRPTNEAKKRTDGPLDRYGWPIEIARAVEYLVTTDSSYVTGQVLRVDGGSQLWPG